MRSLRDDKSSDYVKTLATRSKVSRAYQKHQVLGLEIAEILRDPGHKALYIKLAKVHDADTLLSLAKNIAEKKNVKNFGAYFMRVVTDNLKGIKVKK